jgi:two-component system nitrate/nitrite response regulator NarL
VIHLVILCPARFYGEGLARFLAGVEGVKVEGTVASADQALSLIREQHVDIVLLDVNKADDLTAARKFGAVASPRLVLLGLPKVETEVIACAERGIAGYVTRDSSLEDVVTTIQAAARDELICGPHLAGTLLRHIGTLAAERRQSVERTLTTRELEIVRLIDRGLQNKQIARELQIELPTVKNHVHRILEKLHVHRRTEAAALLRAGALRSEN